MFAVLLAMATVQEAPEPDIDWDAEFGVEERVRDPETGEFVVEPYVESNTNAGADPFLNGSMARIFGEQEGIRRIAERTVAISQDDPRITAIFAAHDMVRLRRTLFEQFCYILNAGCDYTGRDMKTAHAQMGVERSDLNALVENLQQAMGEADISFAAQNRFLSKLAPMSKHIVTR
ncbi:MAG: group 1 truncated hemoglobin [Pontixanthobacter sp.]